MLIEDVALSNSAVALLALQLHRAGYEGLAERVGVAVDTNRPAIRFTRAERRVVLTVLESCPDVLRPLRRALRAVEDVS